MAPAAQQMPRFENGVPVSGDVMSVVVSLISASVLSGFLVQRVIAIKFWGRLPFVAWHSYVFVFVTAILQQAFGVNSSANCKQLAEMYVIRSSSKRRFKSKLYLFNSFGMIGLYAIVAVLNFIFRITRMENGQCIIGMKRVAMIPLISFDFIVNIYLTVLFLIPLKNLYTFKNMRRTTSNIRLRNVAVRTFLGACFLFSSVVIQWITSKDNAASSDNTHTSGVGCGDTTRRSGMEPSQRRGSMMAPGSPHGTDEISLVVTAQTSDDLKSDGKPSLNSASGVIVTTTIRRQSNAGITFDMSQLGDDAPPGYSGFPPLPRRSSYSQGRRDNLAVAASRTKITGGAATVPDI
ncbi:hypothetical protein G7046_g4259 [Stylonectria norvegica]|nr:hypothetical protein G7046_g4259 [Stylonectria norvegica]